MKNPRLATNERLEKIVNGVAVDHLFKTVDAIKATPSIAKFKFCLRNQWVGAGQSSSVADTFYGSGQEQLRSKPFVLEADEPPILLGKDMAANPVEYLLHALASCLTTSMVYHAAARGIQIHAIESSFEGDLDLRGFLNLDPQIRKGYQGIQVNFKISSEGSDEQLQEIVRLGTRH